MAMHETDRLSFRLWTAEDAEAGHLIYADPAVMQYLTGRVEQETVEAQRQKFIEHQEFYHRLLDEGLGVWATVEKATGVPIGTALYKNLRNSAGREEVPAQSEIGWHLRRDKWGMGLGTEIATKLLELSLAREGIARACAFPENRASTRIMEKIGMHYVRTTTEFYDRELVYYEAHASPSI